VKESNANICGMEYSQCAIKDEITGGDSVTVEIEIAIIEQRNCSG
jgi:hypothetical protein